MYYVLFEDKFRNITQECIYGSDDKNDKKETEIIKQYTVSDGVIMNNIKYILLNQ